MTYDSRKPALFWDRKTSQDTDFEECPCFQRRLLGSKRALPGIWKNQYQGQRRPVWGFEAESQEILVSEGYNKDQSTNSGRKVRTQGRVGDKELSILGHGEIHSTGEGSANGSEYGFGISSGFKCLLFYYQCDLGQVTQLL